ncbi:TonB-dependent receptor [Ravibacter arvi]|uniref:TonB-dependent receptor n=1 Tax=Ravibacter arvi TaxID=2051041 RepID=A0ABP8M4P5_9BACT
MKHWYIPKIGSILLLAFFTISSISAVAQQRQVKGTVTSSSDRTAIPGVTIMVKGAQTGTQTNVDGRYEINVGSDQTLAFSFVGFKTKEVSVGNQTEINVILEEDVTTLNEVVAIGYGTQSRATMTTSISKLDQKVLENVPFSNVASALQGSVSGVRVQTVSGQPGAAPRVIVRGGTSINNPNGAQPLYVVDGIIRQDLEGINPSDIESMQVLKDAAATSIYGARASNGVVIIGLKKGVQGKTSINYSYSLGFSNLRKKYDVASARDYIYYGRLGIAATSEKHPERLPWLKGAYGQGIGNDLTNRTGFTTQYLTDENKHKLNEGWESMPDPLDPSKTIIFSNTDWQDVLFRTGITNEHFLSFNGGTEKASFNLGTGYTKIDGIAVNTNYKRFTTNLNGRLKVRDNISVYGGLTFSRFGDNVVYNESQLFQRSLALAPSAKYTYEDGTLAPGFNRSLGNPAYHLTRMRNNNQQNNITVSGGAQWEILPHLTFEPSASLFYSVEERNEFQMSYFDTPVTFIDSRNATASYYKWDQKQADATLTYDNSFNNKHNLSVKAGISYFDRTRADLSASGRGAATDLIPTLNASATPVSVYSIRTDQRLLGFFGRVTYDYERKYLFTLNARYDGASNLGQNNRWGFFPGVSAGWNIHNEEFWPSNKAVTSLKLRGSYGVNGNIGSLSAIANPGLATDFQAQGQYSVGARYAGGAAIQYTTMANQDLKWEQSKTIGIGIDAGLLDDRVRLIADYYDRVTENLITTLPLPQETGFTSILTNLGGLGNKGFEVELTANIVRNQNFQWEVGLNSSYNANKILKLPANNNERNRVGGFYIYDEKKGDYEWKGGLQEGIAPGQLFGYKQLRVYATDEEAAAGPRDELVAGADKSKKGGDVEWADLDKNNIIDPRDRIYTGNIFPKWTGGMSTTLSFRNLSLFARADYTTGHTIYNFARAFMNGQFHGDGNFTTDILRSWLKQGDQTDVPRYFWADQAAQANYWRGDPQNINNGNGRNLDYERGDYLALREITLSYGLPASLLSHIRFTGLRFNVSVNNLAYFTKYRGLMPEDGGMDNGRYPLPRTIIFGVKASF